MIPIFIMGSPRSGTTMVADLLGRSPAVLTTPEAQFYRQILSLRPDPIDSPTARALAHRLVRDFRYLTLGLSLSSSTLAEMAAGGLPCDFLFDLVRLYGRVSNRNDALYWVEHSPDNFLYLDKLFHDFPDARAIHIVRDGRAVLNSYRNLRWGPHSAKRAALRWSNDVLICRSLVRRYPKRIIEIRYEDILADPVAAARRITTDLHINESINLEAPSSLILPKFTRRQHALVGKQFNSGRADAWSSTLSTQDVATFEFYAYTALTEFGYAIHARRSYATYQSSFGDELTDNLKLLSARLYTTLYERLYTIRRGADLRFRHK